MYRRGSSRVDIGVGFILLTEFRSGGGSDDGADSASEVDSVVCTGSSTNRSSVIGYAVGGTGRRRGWVMSTVGLSGGRRVGVVVLFIDVGLFVAAPPTN